MTREDILKEVLSLEGNNWLLELATGTGKSRLALEKVKSLNCKKLLLVVNRNVHKDNWAEEIKKWWPNCNANITMTTYVSLPKYAGEYDCAIMDECFKGSTEILTTRGYIPFTDITEEDKVAQFNDDGTIEFVKPIRLIKHKHLGKLCKVHLGRNRYVYMTPEHYQVYKTKNSQKWEFKEIKDLNFNRNIIIPVSGKGTGNNTIISTKERLAIAIQADGTLQRHQKNESVYSIQVTKQRKKDRLFNLLQEYGNYTVIKGREEVDRYMVKMPKGDYKLLHNIFNINMGYDRATSFIDEVVKWDGSELLKGNTLYYSSRIKENADFVAAVAVQAGYKVFQSIEKDSRKSTYKDIYRVYMRKNTTEVSTKPFSKEYIDYNDYVYCVEVPSHKIVVRSEGYTFISGNCHHLSERCREALCNFNIKNSILLSATVSSSLKDELVELFDNLTFYKKDLRDVIEDSILPDPKVYLIPLNLRTDFPTEVIWKNPKAKGRVIETSYAMRWSYIKQRNYPVKICCTQRQYISDLDSQIDYWKNRYFRSRSDISKNKWLRLCNDRLKWLSDKKTPYVQQILLHLIKYRTLIFCNNIEQTEMLGEYCINSKNKDSANNLKLFNEHKINHITACNMLNEGMNLVDCQIGIYANLNSSDTIIKQRMGRLLRYKNPILIVPYFKGTREEELVNGMLENYNPKLVSIIDNYKKIKI